jgi:hypothetical protein
MNIAATTVVSPVVASITKMPSTLSGPTHPLFVDGAEIGTARCRKSPARRSRYRPDGV